MVSKKQTGFTIVELLIVIVVIGILAAIVIVAYNGVQGRANDAAVKADLSNNAKKLSLYQATNNAWPNLGGLTGEYQLKYTGNSYQTAIFCKNESHVILVSQSTSGNAFSYDTTTGSISAVPASTDPKGCAQFGITGSDPSPSIYTVLSSTGVWTTLVAH